MLRPPARRRPVAGRGAARGGRQGDRPHQLWLCLRPRGAAGARLQHRRRGPSAGLARRGQELGEGSSRGVAHTRHREHRRGLLVRGAAPGEVPRQASHRRAQRLGGGRARGRQGPAAAGRRAGLELRVLQRACGLHGTHGGRARRFRRGLPPGDGGLGPAVPLPPHEHHGRRHLLPVQAAGAQGADRGGLRQRLVHVGGRAAAVHRLVGPGGEPVLLQLSAADRAAPA
mmetsp:Transcript_113339/g.353351  ORF Transcript_113339/g.353351 Transcript_113339/m.353351 type:complete len:228 (-) Transcript_113339:23-706(-)